MTLNKEDLWRFFLCFLKERNVYGKYLVNYNNRDKNYKNVYLGEYRTPYKTWFEECYGARCTMKHIKSDNPTQFINHAFLWRSTKENHNFWCELNEIWLDKLDKIKGRVRYKVTTDI